MHSLAPIAALSIGTAFALPQAATIPKHSLEEEESGPSYHDPKIGKSITADGFALSAPDWITDIAQAQDRDGGNEGLISFNVGNGTVQFLATLGPIDFNEENPDLATFIDLPEHQPEVSANDGDNLNSINLMTSRVGSGWLTAIAGAIHKLGTAAITAFPDLISFGFKVGSRFILRGSRFYPEGCKCYWRFKNGTQLVHRKTGIVLGCDWKRKC